MSIGERVRQARKGAGWTQVTLARFCDVDPATIARIEQGKHTPSSKVRDALARVFPALRTDLSDDPLPATGTGG